MAKEGGGTYMRTLFLVSSLRGNSLGRLSIELVALRTTFIITLKLERLNRSQRFATGMPCDQRDLVLQLRESDLLPQEFPELLRPYPDIIGTTDRKRSKATLLFCHLGVQNDEEGLTPRVVLAHWQQDIEAQFLIFRNAMFATAEALRRHTHIQKTHAL